MGHDSTLSVFVQRRACGRGSEGPGGRERERGREEEGEGEGEPER